MIQLQEMHIRGNFCLPGVGTADNRAVLEIPIARAPEAIWFRLGRSILRGR